MKMNNIHFWILVSIVAISGLSQGLLLPLISIILEKNGFSSSLNGIHATALYIGVLLISPFMEKPLRKYGYKPIIMFGGFIVLLSLAVFPLWHSFMFWFLLRLLIGIGDHMLHFATQTWITDFSPPHRRGRNLSLYGLFFGIGFAVGPLLTPLVEVHQSLPFIISSFLSLLGWLTLFLLKNEYPDAADEHESFFATFKRFAQAWKYAWVALLLPFAYGFLETAVNGSFPIFALRENIPVQHVSVLLPAFTIGGIVFQLPLGLLSDRFPRKTVLIFALFIGCISFITASVLSQSFIALFVCFFIAGMFVGSLFSLGMSYTADLLPKHLLPAGNLLCGILYSIGSIVGPFISGVVIQYWQGGSFFIVISFILLTIAAALFVRKKPEIALK
ncbi:putative MFS family arabinose efflux permease [Anoxybacillus vitaminiphilus]|uniref:Putative MFS family arabinose efflux permease n=1 Tax=Paranoxybacillus vitaminiphilus TaxID=581036 RepID=A0A327YE74_9BACL|nr:MFS transporter [Anoxybacillus vitaminiphilus]RAK19193.1 putative MFS family arabinose efflux permease [Anoxybacillus vitaminiphilus]